MKNYYKVFKSDNRKQLDKECLKLWAEIVKLKANNKCEVCGKTNNLNSHHIFSRSRRSVRLDVQNGMCLCSGCHSLTNESAHKDASFLMKVLGEIDGYKGIRTRKWFDDLYRRAYTPQKLDLNLELIYLKQKLNELKNR